MRRVLVVDDDRDMCRLVAAGLTQRGFDVEWTTSAEQALDLIRGGDLDAVVTDMEMAGMNGIELCERVVTDRPDVPVTMLSAYGDFETAVAALRAGASDFVKKPLEIGALALALERALQAGALRETLKRLPAAAAPAREFANLVGTSPSLRRVVELLERIVASDVSVLITGESGTGKELVARALHVRGRRRAAPFVAVNCAAVPEALLESELFGHVRGAFTDAREDRAGLFVQARGGTLFLDEIADLPMRLQPKLLRALQERKVRPVGGDREVSCDVRLVTATNQDLARAAREGRFREDLYFRINVLQVDVPPLRVRGDDVLLLAQHFLERYAAQAEKGVTGFSAAAAERLSAYDWPGNVRELQNCVERAVALARYDHIGVEDLPERLQTYRRTAPLPLRDTPTEMPLRELERRHILHVLETVAGNRRLAARMLGVDRKTLSRKLARFDLPG